MDPARLNDKIRRMINFANDLASLSTCKQLRVAAIIFPIDCSQVYAIGYNGPPMRVANDSCNGKEGRCGCVHAEANAIAKMNLDTAKPSLMYTTAAPCLHCAGLIVNCHVVRAVMYSEKYRASTGVDMLSRCDVPVIDVCNLSKTWFELFIMWWNKR